MMRSENEPLQQNTNPEVEEFQGIQRIGVSSAGWLFNPEQLFKLLDKINEERAQENKSPLVLELYPTYRPKALNRVAEVTGMVPPTVDADYVQKLLKDYPAAEVNNVHLEFNFSRKEEFIRATFGEDFLPIMPKSSPLQRALMGIKQRAYQVNWMVTMGPAEMKRGINLAQDLHSELGEVGLSAHSNVIEGLGNKIQEIQKKVRHVFAENERPYNLSPHMKRLTDQGIRAREAISDPSTILEHIVKHYGLDGLVYGADHDQQMGKNLAEEYSQVAQAVRMIHISGSESGEVHTPKIDDPSIEELLKTAATSEHSGELVVVLDLNPLLVGKMTPEEQEALICNYTSMIEDIQRGAK